jgi:thiamine-phosphate pyrophosphorylase
MMAEFKHRCRLYFQFPAQPSAKLEAQLAQAIATTDVACVLLCGDGAAVDEDHAERLIDLVQASGLACLIEHDAGLAERLGADGLHIDADPEAYTAARKLLGESANIGVLCGLCRHDAMQLAELGADYVAFGPKAESVIDAIDQYADLIAWWSEIFVVPCVAWNVETAEQAAKFATLGADFVAPSARIWRDDDALRRIAEIDDAVRHVRRAA